MTYDLNRIRFVVSVKFAAHAIWSFDLRCSLVTDLVKCGQWYN